MRGDRLLTILLLLQNSGGRLTTREVAERLEVSERTVDRDMEALGAAGVPVYADRGSAGGWRLPAGYRTDLTGLSRTELQALLIGVPGPAADLGLDEALRGALLKLSAAVPDRYRDEVESVRSKLHIDGAPWHPRNEDVPALLRTVQDAVWAGVRLAVVYRKEDQSLSERLISPLGLVVKSGIWYVVADTDDGLRSFRVSRLTGATATDTPAVRPDGFDLAAYWEQSTAAFKAGLPRYEAVIRFEPDAWRQPALRVRRDRILRTDPPDEHGRFTAVMRFDTIESACFAVLGYGSLAEVLAPEPLREMVGARIAEMHARYSRPVTER